MDHNNHLGQLLHHVSFVLDRQSDQILYEQLGIGLSQYKIMDILARNYRSNQKKLAGTLGQTEAGISRQTSIMKHWGLVTTAINPGDRRHHVVELTLQGKKLYDAANQVLNRYHSPVFSRISDKQQVVLGEILEQMHQSTCGTNRIGSCDYN